MRRNFKDRKILGGVKVTYEISGLNQDRLISELKKRDFTLYNVKKLNNRLMYISVNLRESEKFFAITENLCYNIKKVRLFGKGLPVYKLVKNLGLIFGAVFFLLATLLSNDYILDFSFSGSGSVYKRQVVEYLEGRGVEKFSRFSSFKIERLEDEILANNPNLTFVSLEKKGNTLAVYMTLKTHNSNAVSGKSLELRASESGIVERVKVYRGTALVSVGDRVSQGDLLVEGYVDIKENRVQTGVLACVTLLKSQTFSYRLEGLEKDDVAVMLAEEELKEKEIISSAVTVKEISGRENQFEYTVAVEYRSVIYAD